MNTETQPSAAESAQHTPGPWKWTWSPISNQRIALESSDGKDVLLSTGDDSQAWTELSEANAHLIAAAPALLAALEKTAHFLDGLKMSLRHCGDLRLAEVAAHHEAQARAAIAAAQGAQNK